jgi:hypothetical protein
MICVEQWQVARAAASYSGVPFLVPDPKSVAVTKNYRVAAKLLKTNSEKIHDTNSAL